MEKEELITNLNAIQSDVRALDPNDQESIIKVGAALEQAASELSGDDSGISDLFGLCLEGMMAIYQGMLAEPKHVTAAISGALVAAAQVVQLQGEADVRCLVRSAGSALWLALERDPGTCPYSSEENSDDINDKCAPSNVDEYVPGSLNDIASFLVQIDASDQAGLVTVQKAFECIITSTDIVDAAKGMITEASDIVSAMISGEAENADLMFTRIGELIEAAIDAEEEPEMHEICSQVPELKVVEVKAPEPVIAAPQGAEYLPSDADPSLLGEFITECREYIEGSEAALLAMENNPEDMESVNTVFRAFHTIKGTSAFLGLTRISELAHKAESLLSRVRDQEIKCTGGYADLALRSTDMLKELLTGVEHALSGDPMIEPAGYTELLRVVSDPEAAGISESPLVVVSGGLEIAVSAPKQDVQRVTETPRAPAMQKKASSGDSAIESSVRVRTDRLDRLIDMVGELVIAQSIVSQDDAVIQDDNHDLSKKIIHMGKIVRELQYLSMSMRMVPLKSTFQKMARLVRDVSQKSGKQVEFITEGEDTEIDRNMVDIINDPLVHMVRNAVDHGIESPEIRESNGKARTGKVRLMAYHSGGNVVVEMRDDGKGLDRERIVEKAISKGLIDSDKGMTETEVYNLIFEPGFSTAEKVTDISGRGVGLDVVKRNIEKLRGKVEINSVLGEGCTFSMRLPLTLAVTDGMLVKVGDERFIIPTINIHLSFRPEPGMLSTVTGTGELVMLRGELMPIFRMHHLFGIEGAVNDPTKGLLVILDDGDRRCALLVDELLGQHHVVAKSLGDGIGKVPGLSGGAILGDGRVGLIIDVTEIVSIARQLSTSCGREELAVAVA